MPRRRVGRSRLTEGETSELDEHHFNGDITFARTIEQAGGGADARRTGEVRRVDGRAAAPWVENWKSPWPKVRTTPYSVAVRVSIVSAIRERAA